MPKNAFWGFFGKVLPKSRVFSARAPPPSKLVYFGAEGSFRKVLGWVSQKWISQNSTKGVAYGLSEGRIPEKKRPPAPSLLNPPLAEITYFCWVTLKDDLFNGFQEFHEYGFKNLGYTLVIVLGSLYCLMVVMAIVIVAILWRLKKAFVTLKDGRCRFYSLSVLIVAYSILVM